MVAAVGAPQRAQVAQARRGEQRAPGRRRPRLLGRVRRAQRDSSGRAVGQAHEQAALPAHRPVALHREPAPREWMLRRDDHHLGRQRSAQLTQSVWLFVIMRKVQGGTQSEQGNRWIERILSVNETCCLQGRAVLDYLLEAADAAHHGRPSPSLVPP
jgi:hypothetical protein